VGPVYLFDLAGRHSQWLAVRQSAIAGNVANANTPSYQAKGVRPFEEVISRTQLAMAASNPRHMQTSGTDIITAAGRGSSAASPSRNAVSLEQEMIAAGEVSRDFALNTSIVKSFHRMLMSCVRV
jgi:flagellar basal-body rod protein FlgB